MSEGIMPAPVKEEVAVSPVPVEPAISQEAKSSVQNEVASQPEVASAPKVGFLKRFITSIMGGRRNAGGEPVHSQEAPAPEAQAPVAPTAPEAVPPQNPEQKTA